MHVVCNLYTKYNPMYDFHVKKRPDYARCTLVGWLVGLGWLGLVSYDPPAQCHITYLLRLHCLRPYGGGVGGGGGGSGGCTDPVCTMD